MINEIHDEQSDLQLSRKAVKGIAWNFLAYGLGKVTVLITTSILAHIMTKNDLGIVALALVALNFLSIVKDFGLGAALIQRRGDVEDAAHTVFTFNLILGIVLSALVFPFAPLIANYYGNPIIAPVLRFLGLSFAINALGAVHVLLLMRGLDYRRKFIPDMGNAIVKAIVSIGMAAAGFGVWSLVWGQISGAVVSVILVWILVPWKPRLALDSIIARDLLKFGTSVMGVDMITVITDNIDYLVVGRLFGLAQLSIYTYAYRLPEMLLIGNLWVMGSVIFPTFSSIQDRPDQLKRGFLVSVRLVQFIAAPICFGLFIAAAPIVKVVFGSDWLEVIPMLRILSIFAWVYSVGFHIGGVYKAIGRPDILFKLSLLTLVTLVSAVFIGSLFGTIGVAWGVLVAVIIRRVASLAVAKRFADIDLLSIFDEIKTSLLAGLVMMIVVFVVLSFTSQSAQWVQLILAMVTGAVSYLGILWLIERDNLLRLVNFMGISKTSVS